ncbi:hypothetical protein AB6H27_18295 [Providencia huaxiensis]|uniref:hypothetical protein n=1 Tax=Providencia TaxID=586 RepID=UPI00234BC249|nr:MULTISPECIES: hypothetical protein [Providencia]ELR5055622.1 hypothetical protein [Providencia rettgeri]ELR5084947.1 hypothetical protein [Providencia rettgeri]ELR5107352.1 hypothetical protein [Providencia rettgeri]ELR5282305.1 hypothetical protein [Providencia rettgeri]ELY3854413.1 hypothetical protein [Providencia rettgeri]
MASNSHNIEHEELQGFDVYRYLDVKYTFSGDVTRQITFRLVFCKEESNQLLVNLYGDELTALVVSVVSFYNIDAEGNEKCDTVFERPPDAIALTSVETRYFYRTLIDIILKIAETENIQVLTFQAYSEELKRVYDRLVRRYSKDKNLTTHTEGACYVIRMED